MTFPHIKHFVIHPRYMKTQSGIAKCFSSRHFSGRQPTACRKGKVQPVAVIFCFRGRDDGQDGREYKSSDALEVVDDLFLFVKKLGFVIDLLPGINNSSTNK